MTTPVTLYVYDLSNGLAKTISPFILGRYVTKDLSSIPTSETISTFALIIMFTMMYIGILV